MEKINLNIGSKIFVNNQEYEIKTNRFENYFRFNLFTNKLENISQIILEMHKNHLK